jgi:predicted Zn-dependent peptidase
MAETEKPEELLKNIVKSMKNIKVTEEEFERKKKVLISEFISCFNDLNGLNQKILFTKANFNIDFISLFNLIEKLNYQELLKIIAKLDMSNKTVVILESKNS